MSLQIWGVAGTDGWTDISNYITDVCVEAEREAADDELWGYSWTAPQTFSMEFEIKEIAVETLELVYGMPFHPVKRRGLTGKAYRQACRRYQRRLKAFRLGEVDWRGVV